MKTKVEIRFQIYKLEKELEAARQELFDFESDINQNIYSSHQEAEGHIYNRYYDIAALACEGRCNYGCDEYKQLYMVDGAMFEATTKFVYNRFDKQYYFIDTSSYCYKQHE